MNYKPIFNHEQQRKERKQNRQFILGIIASIAFAIAMCALKKYLA